MAQVNYWNLIHFNCCMPKCHFNNLKLIADINRQFQNYGKLQNFDSCWLASMNWSVVGSTVASCIYHIFPQVRQNWTFEEESCPLTVGITRSHWHGAADNKDHLLNDTDIHSTFKWALFQYLLSLRNLTTTKGFLIHLLSNSLVTHPC